MKKRLMALLLATGMILSCLTGCGQSESGEKKSSSAESQSKQSEVKTSETASSQEPESKWPEYLNMDSAFPIVKDEYADDITLTLTIVQPDAMKVDWDKTWLFTYFKEKYNLNFDVNIIPAAAKDERKNTLLSTGSTTDIMIDLGLTTQELAKYGQQEELFLATDEYISEELTPGLYYWLYGEGGREDARLACTTNDGHMYTLPNLNVDTNAAIFYKVFINQKYLDTMGVKTPTTLDEFVDVLYKMKKEDPAGVGSENFYPFGGGISSVHQGYYILNAMGYMTTDSTGSTVTVRNGEAVIPAYDLEVFAEYLKLMKQFYDDGIMAPNAATITADELNAQMLKNQVGVYYSVPYLTKISTWKDWEALSPLTSKWNDTAKWNAGKAAAIGNIAIASDTEYPELCMRFADIFFNHLTDDPAATNFMSLNPEYNYGFEPVYVYDAEAQALKNNPNIPDGLSAYEYRTQRLMGFTMMFGVKQLEEADSVWRNSMGYKYKEKEKGEWTGDSWYRDSVSRNVIPYATDEIFPYFYFLDEEAVTKVTDLTGVIEPHVKQTVAEFITGKRPLTDDELAKFKKELEDMGIKELLEIYKEVNDAYKANKAK